MITHIILNDPKFHFFFFKAEFVIKITEKIMTFLNKNVKYIHRYLYIFNIDDFINNEVGFLF